MPLVRRLHDGQPISTGGQPHLAAVVEAHQRLANGGRMTPVVGDLRFQACLKRMNGFWQQPVAIERHACRRAGSGSEGNRKPGHILPGSFHAGLKDRATITAFFFLMRPDRDRNDGSLGSCRYLLGCKPPGRAFHPG